MCKNNSKLTQQMALMSKKKEKKTVYIINNPCSYTGVQPDFANAAKHQTRHSGGYLTVIYFSTTEQLLITAQFLHQPTCADPPSSVFPRLQVLAHLKKTNQAKMLSPASCY